MSSVQNCEKCNALTRYNDVCAVCEWQSNDHYTGLYYMQPENDHTKIPLYGSHEVEPTLAVTVQKQKGRRKK